MWAHLGMCLSKGITQLVSVKNPNKPLHCAAKFQTGSICCCFTSKVTSSFNLLSKGKESIWGPLDSNWHRLRMVLSIGTNVAWRSTIRSWSLINFWYQPPTVVCQQHCFVLDVGNIGISSNQDWKLVLSLFHVQLIHFGFFGPEKLGAQ